MAQDGVELAELLLKSLQKDKIILLGHSWGSILGVFMVKARPDFFYAFVGTDQVADPAKAYAVAYGELLKRVEDLGEQRAIDELREIGPPAVLRRPGVRSPTLVVEPIRMRRLLHLVRLRSRTRRPSLQAARYQRLDRRAESQR